MSLRDRLIAACAFTVALASGCVHPPRSSGAPERSAPPVLAEGWSPVVKAPDPLLAVPAGLPVVGLGAKISPRGLLPKRCLSRAESSAEGGSFSVEVHAVSEPFQHGDLDVVAFVESAVRRAAQARPTPGGVAPVSALLVVRTVGQWTTLNEPSATFSEEIGRLLSEGQDWDFFERCGTHYVHAARRELSALVFVALYPADAAQRAKLEARIAQKAGAARDDLLTLRVLDQFVEQVPSFLAVRADADQVMDVVELGLRGPAAGRTGALVGNALRASFGADRGRVVDVGLRPWSALPAAGALFRDRREQLGAEPGRRERLFQQLKLLEGRALDRETLLAQVTEVAGAGTCKAALARSLSPFSWDAYYRCRTAARDTLPAALEEVQACQPVLAALSSDRLPEVCERLMLDEGRFPDPRKRSDTRYPLLLERGDDLQRRRQAEPDGHLYADDTQFALAPSPVTVGAQTDRWGRGFPNLCVQSPEESSAAEEPRPLRPWNPRSWDDLYLQGTRPALVTPHDLDGRETPPEEGADENGPVCIQVPGAHGTTPLCLREKGEGQQAPGAPVPPTSAAKPAAAPKKEPGDKPEVVLGVSANYRLDGERRWPWWKKLLYPLLLSWREPEPPRPIYRGAYEVRSLQDGGSEEIRLTEEAVALARKDLPAFYRACGTHRLSQVIERKGFAYYLTHGSPGDIEISVLPYGVSPEAAGGRPFHPEQVRDFFSGRAELLEQLSERSPGLPAALVLEPWSEILLGMGLVQPHELSPQSDR